MDDNKNTPEILNETQSLLLIKEMIQVSRNKLYKDGILFILWGWVLFINTFLLNYLTSVLNTPHQMMNLVRPLRVALPIAALVYSLFYVFSQRKRVQTYIGISLRYLWFSLFFGLVLVNLVLFNVLHQINFELQHPIFMIFIAFAITVTGGILRYKLFIFGGLLFAVLAYTASYFHLREQLLIESIAWLIAFIIPGHLLYANRNK